MCAGSTDPVVRVPISRGTGGSEPRWGADWKELFYLTDTSMMAVEMLPDRRDPPGRHAAPTVSGQLGP